MEKNNKLKIEQTNNINPEFFSLFAQELEQIDKKEKVINNKNKEISNVNNDNDNIIIFISKQEIKKVRKLLNVVDKLIINSKKK